MGKDSIQIAVRVRPFASHEAGQTNIVKMDSRLSYIVLILLCCCLLCFLASSGKVTLTNPDDKTEKDYFYDYCFWSHDNKQGRKLFTNSDLYDKIGTELLSNAYSGYNSTVFAYGQTGSGKSYSIEGSKDDKGLLQRVCEAIFDKKTEVDKVVGNSLDIYASYLEIYNENLRDLLDCTDKELKIFQTNNTIFVKNLSRVFCDDFGDISKLLEDGKKMRVVGATSMNKQSSRSHAIFTLFVTLKSTDAKTNKASIKTSEIHIVDLAGSERQAKTNASGSRLKEGSNINKSLTFLGVVIEKLSTLSDKKGSNEHIPYRNSQLTYLLSESLGGNSKTIMIAAVSPAASNFEETTSTLMFADRAAAITNKSTANVNEESNLKAKLANELDLLKQQMKELESLSKTPNLIKSKDDASQIEERKKNEELILKYKEEIKAQQEMMKNLEVDREEEKKKRKEIEQARRQKLADGGLTMDELREEMKIDPDTPYLLNISDDPTLSGCLVYYLKNKSNIIGSKTETCDIVLKGLGIFDEHCKIEIESLEKVKLVPSGRARTLVNGNFLAGSTYLKSNKRIVFGNGNAWKIIIPKIHVEKEDKSKNTYNQIMMDRLKSDTPESNNIRKFLDETKERIGDDKTIEFTKMFAEALDKVDEANEYSRFRYHHTKDKEKKVCFTIEVMMDIMDYGTDLPEIAIRMRKKETNDVIYLWDYAKFKERVDMMQQWYADIQDDGVLNNEGYFDPWNEVTEGNIKDQREDEFLSLEEQYAKLQDMTTKLENKMEDLRNQKETYFKKNKEAWNAKEKDLDTMVMVLINDEAPSSADEEELLERYKKGKNINKDDLINWEKSHRELKETNDFLKKLHNQKSELEAQLNEVKRIKDEEFDNVSLAESLGDRIELLRNHNSEFGKRLEMLQKELAREKSKIAKLEDKSGCCTIF